jgi:hypothetical protein
MKVSSHFYALAALPQGTNPGTQWTGSWASELVWTFRRREKSLVPSRIRTQDRPVPSLVAIPSAINITLLTGKLLLSKALKTNERECTNQHYCTVHFLTCLHISYIAHDIVGRKVAKSYSKHIKYIDTCNWKERRKHLVCHEVIWFTQEPHASARWCKTHQCPHVEIRMTPFSVFHNTAKCVSYEHVQFGTQLCVSGRNFKARLLFLTVAVYSTPNNKRHFTCQLTALCNHCILTLTLATNVSKLHITPCPFILAAAVSRVPSANLLTHFTYISPLSEAAKLSLQLHTYISVCFVFLHRSPR